MKTSTTRQAAGALLLLALTASPLYAFDATGTWTGEFSCKNFTGAKSTFKMKPSVLLIVQSGSVVKADIDGGSFLYSGSTLDDFKKPDEKGEVLLTQCGTDHISGVGFAEMVRAAVKVDPSKGKGSLSGISITEGDYGSGYQFSTCKYKFKRTGTGTPIVADCP